MVPLFLREKAWCGKELMMVGLQVLTGEDEAVRLSI